MGLKELPGKTENATKVCSNEKGGRDGGWNNKVGGGNVNVGNRTVVRSKKTGEI